MTDVKVITPTDLDEVTVKLNPQGKVEVDFDVVKQYVHSRMGGLVSNGYGTLNNNLNFSRFEFDPTVATVGAGGFTTTVRNADFPIDELIPISSSLQYTFSFYAKSLGGGENNLAYAYIAPYDVDGNAIQPIYIADTIFGVESTSRANNTVTVKVEDRQKLATRLAQIPPTSPSISLNTTDYVAKNGYKYNELYSRERVVKAFRTRNQIQYDPDTGVITGFEVTKDVSNTTLALGIAGATYIYAIPTMVNHAVPTEPTFYSLTFMPQQLGINTNNKRAMAVASFIKVGWLLNRGSSPGHKTAIWAVDVRAETPRKTVNDGAGQVVFTEREATVDLQYNGIQFIFRQVANANRPMLMTGILYQGTWYGDSPDDEVFVNPFG